MNIYKTPTPEEINEAAEKYAHGRVFPPQKVEYSYSLLSIMKRQKESAKEDFIAAISWLQNYQTQQQGYVRSGIELIAEERQSQIEKHGFTVDHDQQYNDENAHHEHGELAYAASHALWPGLNFYPRKWASWFRDKIIKKTYKQRLIIAGALLAAEIDRLNKLEEKNQQWKAKN